MRTDRPVRAIVAIGLILAWLGRAPAADPPVTVTAKSGMVVTVSAPASEVGVEILKRGGNAVDAAVAVAFALLVAWPEAGNIGGGGFMLVHPADGRPPVCVEYRETAPSASTAAMYSLTDSRLGHKMVGVPGTLRGLELAHREFGTLPWSRLVAPAFRMAREGIVVDDPLARSLNEVLDDEKTRDYPEFKRIFSKPDGSGWQPGDRFTQPELAETLGLIAEQGPSAFYEGAIARQIVNEMTSGKGLITQADLADYRANLRTPVRVQFRGYDVYGPPPPSSGGICLALMLNMLDEFDLKAWGRWSPDTLHVLVGNHEAGVSRTGAASRRRRFRLHPAAPDGQRNSQRQLARTIDMQARHAQPRAGAGLPIAGGIDRRRRIFRSSTGRHGGLQHLHAGAATAHGWSSAGAGFLLNNEMGDFNWIPGHTDDARAHRHPGQSDRAGQADAQLADADDRGPRRQGCAGDRQSRAAGRSSTRCCAWW